MYTTKDFANILGVTPQTLRNKHKRGELVPSMLTENNYRLYTDENAYRYNPNRKILFYSSRELDGSDIEDKIKSFNIDYEIHENSLENTDYINNTALIELLKNVTQNKTYTILYHMEYITKEDLNIIKFYVNNCFPNIRIKELHNFSVNTTDKGE